MKKLVIAAAVLGAFAGTAQAQSSVTLFGVVDTNVTHVTGIDNGIPHNGHDGKTSRTYEDGNGLNTSRIGFRGTEDLGGGLKAGFWLEAGINANNGSGTVTNTNNQSTGSIGGGGLTFNRRATVSLIGESWGEVRIGRDYVPTYWNAVNADPMGYDGIGSVANFLQEPQGAMGTTALRASNGISYLTPNTLGGIFLQGTYALGNNASNQTAVGCLGPSCNIGDDGTYYGINVGYQNGPIYAGLATAETKFAQSTLATKTALAAGNIHVTNLGASYNFGFVKPDIFLQTTKVDGVTPARTNVWSLGAVVPAGQGEFRVNYAHANGHDAFAGSDANLIGLAYVYNLSKRTALYAELARVSNSGKYDFSLNNENGANQGPAEGQTESGVSLGIRTSF